MVMALAIAGVAFVSYDSSAEETITYDYDDLDTEKFLALDDISDGTITLKNGKTYHLTETVLVKESLKIELNGATIYSDGTTFKTWNDEDTEKGKGATNVNLEINGTVTGSKIISKGTVVSGNYVSNSKLTVNGGYYEGTHVFIWYAQSGATGVEVSITGAFVDASVAGFWFSNSTIDSVTIERCNIESDILGIYFGTAVKVMQMGHTVVKSTDVAIEIKSGNITIQDSKIDSKTYMNSTQVVSGGSGMSCSAIVVNDLYNSIIGTDAVYVTISGCELNKGVDENGKPYAPEGNIPIVITSVKGYPIIVEADENTQSVVNFATMILDKDEKETSQTITHGYVTYNDVTYVDTESSLRSAITAEMKNIRIVGDIELTDSLSVPADCKLVVDEGKTLTVGEGKVLTINGTLELNGTLDLHSRLCLVDDTNNATILLNSTSGVTLGGDVLVGMTGIEFKEGATARITDLKNPNGFVVTVETGIVDIKGGFLSVGKLTQITIGSDATAILSKDGANYGILTINGVFNVAENVKLSNYGVIETQGIGKVVLNTGSMYKGFEYKKGEGISYFNGKMFGPDGENNVKNSLDGMLKGFEVDGTPDTETPSITVKGGSLTIDGKIITETGSEGDLDITVSGDNISIKGEVAAGSKVEITGNTTVTVDGQLKVGDNAVISVGDGSKLVNESTIIISQTENKEGRIEASSEATVVPGTILNKEGSDAKTVYPEYEEGTKVTVKGTTYTVYKNTFGDITLQYGLSCGDIYYSGSPVSDRNVTLLSTSLTTGYNLTNQTFDFNKEDCVAAGPYTDALHVQLTFSGPDGNITANKDIDLIILEKPLSMGVDASKGTIGENNVSDFQKITVTLGEKIVLAGYVGYYNFGTDSMSRPGYYVALDITFGGAIESDQGRYVFSENGTIKDGFDGKYLRYLGATATDAKKALEETTLSVSINNNYESVSYGFNTDGLTFATPLSVGNGDSELFNEQEITGSVDVSVAANLKWKTEITPVNSAKNAGWFLGLKFGSEVLTGYKAVMTVGNVDYNVNGFNGGLVIRQMDNSDITVMITDANGLKTKYTVDTDNVRFAEDFNYYKTKAEFDALLTSYGITLTGETKDQTMYMIFNDLGQAGYAVSAESLNDPSKDVEGTVVDLDGNGVIWYYSFTTLPEGEEPVAGPYKIVAKATTTEIATGTVVKDGVYTIAKGYNDDKDIVTSEMTNILDGIGDVPGDVIDETFYWIVKVYGYDSETTLTVNALNKSVEGSTQILIGGNTFKVPHETDKENHVWILYFSFKDTGQVTGGKVPGNYEMTILNGSTPIAQTFVPVGSDISANFSAYDATDKSDYVGGDYTVTSSSKTVTVAGTIKANAGGYFIPLKFTATNYVSISINGVETATSENNCYLVYVDEGTETFDVVFYGDGTIYRNTTYKVNITATYETATYKIILMDTDYYGVTGFEYATKSVGQGIILPNGPAVGKEFKGWKVEGIDAEKYFAAGSLMVVSEDIIVDGKITLKAIYRGDMQRTNFNMKIDVDVNDGKLTITVDSNERDGYRNLTANHYYVINIVDSNLKNIYSKVIPSSTILNGGDVYSETITRDINGLGAGCSVSVKFAADYAPGMEPLASAFISVPVGEVVGSGYKEDRTVALDKINEAIHELDDQKYLVQENVANETMYMVFKTDIEYKGLVAGLSYVGDDGLINTIYVEKFDLDAGAHVWLFSFADNEPSHSSGNGVLKPLTEDYDSEKKYILKVTTSDGKAVIAQTVI